MKPEDARDWLPVVRDYLLMFVGVFLIAAGVVAGSRKDLVLAGLILAGLGGVVRAWFDARINPLVRDERDDAK